TSPLLETVAIALLLVVHVTTRPVVVAQVTSRTTADNCVLACSTMATLCGCTVTLPTAKLDTTTLASALFPSTFAVIFTEPTETAVTIPAAETVAIVESDVDQLIAR